MRVYIPLTSSILRGLSEHGRLSASPITAFAVTPGLREWYVDDDIEELEYAASSEAARASLRLISADDTAVPRRIVLAADVEDVAVTVRDDLDRGVVRIESDVPLSACASVHADDAEAQETVARAAENIDAADLGDLEAEEVVDDADGYELSWYAMQEIEDLLADLAR
ncbi:MAG: hypothetical protein QOK10_2223 [Pseudonocardiales bacterium]|jgi:hypothetical protein|nr:hypothetical protein [Pseudonocardiales bacterium]